MKGRRGVWQSHLDLLALCMSMLSQQQLPGLQGTRRKSGRRSLGCCGILGCASRKCYFIFARNETTRVQLLAVLTCSRGSSMHDSSDTCLMGKGTSFTLSAERSQPLIPSPTRSPYICALRLKAEDLGMASQPMPTRIVMDPNCTHLVEITILAAALRPCPHRLELFKGCCRKSETVSSRCLRGVLGISPIHEIPLSWQHTLWSAFLKNNLERAGN